MPLFYTQTLIFLNTHLLLSIGEKEVLGETWKAAKGRTDCQALNHNIMFCNYGFVLKTTEWGENKKHNDYKREVKIVA